METVTRFWRHIYGTAHGLLQIWTGIRREDDKTKFNRETIRLNNFNYPKAANNAAQWALQKAEESGREVYFCTHLLIGPERSKENAADVHALWGELDGVDVPNGELKPTALIESSPGHYHCYWGLADAIPATTAEDLNARLAHAIGADPSGFDLTQLLRVPLTTNNKYEDAPPVRLEYLDGSRTYLAGDLDRALPQLPGSEAESSGEADEEPGALGDEPPVALRPGTFAVWRGEEPKLKDDGKIDRSASLMQIGRTVYDAGANKATVVSALAERDRSLGWHKYSDNRDGGRREYERIYQKLEKEGRNNVTHLRPSAGAIDAIDANPKKLPAPAEFPVHAMPKHCQGLVHEASEAIGCAPEMVALPMLAVLSAAIGNSRRLKVKGGWEEGACIYAAVIAEPGEKKTPAQVVATEPARRIQTKLKRAYLEQLEAHEKELRQHEVDKAKAKKEGEAAEAPPKKPTFKRTVVGDITTEALAVVLEENPRGVLMNRDELAGWVRGMDQYKAGGKGSDRQFWLSVHTNQDTHIDRKSQEPIHLTKPFSSVFGSIQPDVLPEISSNREDGMLERFLYAYPEPVLSGWSDTEISVKAKSAYDFLYEKLWSLELAEDVYGCPEPELVEFSPEAKECFIAAYNEHYQDRRSPGFPRALKGVWPKLEGYLARLTLILGTCRSEAQNKPARIEPVDVLLAQRLIGYFKNHAHRTYAKLYGEDPDDQLAEDLVRFLAEREGVFEGSAAELHEQLKSEHKPKSTQWFSKKLEQLAERSPGLFFERDQVADETSEGRATSKRVVRLVLENYVNCVNEWKSGG